MLLTTGLRPRLTPEAEKGIGDSPPPGRGFSFTLIICGSMHARSYVLTQADKLIKKLLYYRSKALGGTGESW